MSQDEVKNTLFGRNRIYQKFHKHILKFPYCEHIFRFIGLQQQNDETCLKNSKKMSKKTLFGPFFKNSRNTFFNCHIVNIYSELEVPNCKMTKQVQKCPKKCKKDPFRPKYALSQKFQKHIFKLPHYEHIYRFRSPQQQNDETCPKNVFKKL